MKALTFPCSSPTSHKPAPFLFHNSLKNLGPAQILQVGHAAVNHCIHFTCKIFSLLFVMVLV
ncbi:hypothetical protein AHF37_02348 [Paragonimus kellicotti]|nr:hypothetical protein AHF37_02348 [Paragonimus kellicotti]